MSNNSRLTAIIFVVLAIVGLALIYIPVTNNTFGSTTNQTFKNDINIGNDIEINTINVNNNNYAEYTYNLSDSIRINESETQKYTTDRGNVSLTLENAKNNNATYIIEYPNTAKYDNSIIQIFGIIGFILVVTFLLSVFGSINKTI